MAHIDFPPNEFLKKEGGMNLGKYEQLEKKLDREKKIKHEVNRLKKLYKDLDKDIIKSLDGLITNAAFMKITLEETMEELLKNGTVELFEQGEQSFKRERPEFKIYGTLTQRYPGIMKQLIDLLPVGNKDDEKSALMQFMQRNKIKK